MPCTLFYQLLNTAFRSIFDATSCRTCIPNILKYLLKNVQIHIRLTVDHINFSHAYLTLIEYGLNFSYKNLTLSKGSRSRKKVVIKILFCESELVRFCPENLNGPQIRDGHILDSPQLEGTCHSNFLGEPNPFILSDPNL